MCPSRRAVALAASGWPASGASVRAGLHRLSRANSESEPIPLEAEQLARIYAQLRAAEPVNVLGASAPLRGGDDGAIGRTQLASWCIARSAEGTAFEASGLTLELPAGEVRGDEHGCASDRDAPK